MKRLDEFFAQLVYDYVTWRNDRGRRRTEIAPLAKQRELNYRAVYALVLAAGFTTVWGVVNLASHIGPTSLLAASSGVFLVLGTVFAWATLYAWFIAVFRVTFAYLYDSRR